MTAMPARRWPDIDRVSDLIRLACREIMLPRFRSLKVTEIRQKRPGDPVTVVDEAMEARLAEGLTALLPGAAILGEEGVAADPSRRAALAGSDPVWVIDPLDGTLNFVKGVPRFASLVTLVQDDRPVIGWVYDPLGDRMAVAEAGQGTWLDGVRVPVPEDRPVSQLRASLPPPHAGGPWRDGLVRLTERVAERQGMTCAGHVFLDLLTGRTDLAVFRKLTPWDHAGGVLAWREAGGTVDLIDGGGYRVSLPAGPLILAPGAGALAETRAALALQAA